MSQDTNPSASSVGASGLLGVAFVALKLTHFIDWAWKWETAPCWVLVCTVAIILALVAVFAAIDRRSR